MFRNISTWIFFSLTILFKFLIEFVHSLTYIWQGSVVNLNCVALGETFIWLGWLNFPTSFLVLPRISSFGLYNILLDNLKYTCILLSQGCRLKRQANLNFYQPQVYRTVLQAVTNFIFHSSSFFKWGALWKSSNLGSFTKTKMKCKKAPYDPTASK